MGFYIMGFYILEFEILGRTHLTPQRNPSDSSSPPLMRNLYIFIIE